MKIEVTFHHTHEKENIESVRAYVQTRMERLHKYEMKPSHTKIHFSAKHHECEAALEWHGPQFHGRANGTGEDHWEAFDRAMEKLERQLARQKQKVQTHKRKKQTHEGKLERMSPQLEQPALRSRPRRSRPA